MAGRASLAGRAGRAARTMVAMGAGILTWLVSASVAVAASPTPSRPPSTDTRSALEGPGFVGSPELAILGVLAIAVLAILATLVYVRITGGRGTRPP